MKPNILFVNGGVKEFGNRFRQACEKRDINCTSIRTHNNSFIYANKQGYKYFHLGEEINLRNFDYCFIRVKGKFSHMTTLLSSILKFEKIQFNDANNLHHTMNDEKITQMVKFACHKLPIPETIIFSRISFRKNKEKILNMIKYPCVLKTNGSKGNAVWKIESETELISKIKTITQDLMMVQEYLKNEYDVRALFMEDKLIGAIRRYSNDGFYNNVAKGGKSQKDDPTESEIELCQKAMKVLGLNFGGADFIRHGEDIIFFEINKGPQVYGLEEALGLDVSDILVEEIQNKFKLNNK